MVHESIPAVIMAGGKSSRMGSDKFMLDYGMGPQWKVLAEKLRDHFGEIYVSCREDQRVYFEDLPCIPDLWENTGPIGGITSSLVQIPSCDSILVIGCDLPFFDTRLADRLVAQNDLRAIACCAQLASRDFPEPLTALWNRCALPLLQEALAQENYSLQKLLKTHPHVTVNISEEHWLFNVNTKEDYQRVLSSFNLKHDD